MKRRDYTLGAEIINDRIKKLYETSLSSLSSLEKEEIYDVCIHDIQDCLYWLKFERDSALLKEEELRRTRKEQE